MRKESKEMAVTAATMKKEKRNEKPSVRRKLKSLAARKKRRKGF